MNKNPEQKARDRIDKKLALAGWTVQDVRTINFSAGRGIAVREYQTAVGPADYVLFVDKTPVGVIEAKREKEGHRLTVHEGQAEYYAESRLKWVADSRPLSFIYESTGLVTRFTDARDPKPRSGPVFSFHRPETLAEWLKQGSSLRDRLTRLPALPGEGLRECQISAITGLETSFRANRPRALVQMATGAGKTFTAITSVYRLLKHANAKRVLFLVDTKNLGEQAEQEFMAFTPSDDNRKFTELYAVQRLTSGYAAPDSQVCISTIQRMYSILRKEALDGAAEETNPNEITLTGRPREVDYNPDVPPEFFDFIIIDECHRSIYNLWKQVLDYFDAFLIGLTATPDKRTFGFFNENVVSEYPHETAVADGVNVGFEVYTIETEITKNGGMILQQYIEKRDRLTRKKRWEQMDEDVSYGAARLDRDVVNPSQIRNVIKTFRDKLPEIFPGREEIPKTLIFAKTDSHADDIINTVREEFGEGNDFCKKVTYQVKDAKSVLSSLRNDYNPRIAVTVDMIATGTDVKPLECLLFMRDVRSKNYFEQMKGRGTRTLGSDDLRQVTPSAVGAKTHFVMVDAVGVTKSLKMDSRPLERKKSVPLKDLMMNVMMGSDDEDVFTSLASRLSRLDRQITPKEKQGFQERAEGKSVAQVARALLDAHNPDKIEETAREKSDLPEDAELSGAQEAAARKELVRAASDVFTGELVGYIENVRKSHEQIMDTVNIDQVNFAGWDRASGEKAGEVVADFREFMEAHKDEITALKIYYNQPHLRKDVTFEMLRDVLDILKQSRPTLAPVHVWQAYAQLEKVDGKSPENELTALVSLIRRVAGVDESLTAFDKTVNRNFQRWVFQKQAGTLKFNEDQMEWLRMIKDHIMTSVHLERDDLDYAPFDGRGGIGGMYQVFGDEMDDIIEEMNEEMAA
ncbi:restriction endonuclease subunit R [Desulfonema ishimotonii]|uniref:Restriction endonuclease subunit R n=1 Tax=Desulfonema ishimotonii TaxID=45657 RepID=A0A401FV09_9BACT|nr:type I restriction-modification enzyme R subunit C-terminal domain-containing protein [Desulfonema ishimotonii]GBC60817.1 restriction endonuclease subunit R [Desulfonema ishimotonii]